ncbi:hypothetical protein [Roseibacillus ishigakijimensis]|uniref:Uncharacterized protein n=1 Tax=Roseibacillus ishigakijimensis TaxID=454146 RepID=A0A934RTP1_9BACT|nr:hypothetical protein [Roseibacillus ishigakijimensis]
MTGLVSFGRIKTLFSPPAADSDELVVPRIGPPPSPPQKDETPEEEDYQPHFE